MTPLGNRIKDPNEFLDYTVKWQDKLGTDTILSSTWTVESGTGLILSDPSFNNTSKTTTIWAGSGTDGVIYTLRNHVVTTGGRIIDEFFFLTVESKA
jgi:hypothetical protein